MTVRVRIAPSPTGNLHIGTARTAVFNWLFARHCGGKFILRIEDTDLERSRPEYTENIKSGLIWLGLNWDEGPFFQTQRLDFYRQAIQTLLDKGLAYHSYTSAEELTKMRQQQEASKQAPRYDNRDRNLTPEQKAAYEKEGRKPVIRFKIEDEREIVWNDAVRGEVTWKGSDLGGDMVVARAAEKEGEAFGQPLYNLAVVVDDIDMQINYVIRGEDHIANTAKQILLYEALGASVPKFAHTPLILDREGKKLSKRDNVTSIDEFKQKGFLPEAMANYMSLLGWTPPDSTQEIFTLAEAAENFSLERINKAGAKFDWDKLDWINSQYLHKMPPERLVGLLIPYWQEAGFQFDPQSARAWLEQLAALIAPSLTRLSDAASESHLLFGESLNYSEEAIAQLKLAGVADVIKAVLEAIPANLSEAEAKAIIDRVVKAQNVKKGLVMKSLRAALMGELQGPDLIQSWLLLNQKGWDKSRLQQSLGRV